MKNTITIKLEIDLSPKCLKALSAITGIDFTDVANGVSDVTCRPEPKPEFKEWESLFVVPETGMWTKATLFYESYFNWCEANGHEVMSQKGFGNSMTSCKHRREKRGGTVYYVGISLKV